ncbi:zinc finger protein 281-like isoform X2 [Corythoichthys intestinalis]|uniref:zinc finger protein 281-like isoform X2 n=1 Tax=Corythoichthys intestinalis TaxID=161448 RepID=UPI0025A577C1|nr:zinc finger protein 281-like isoform X2 [Corythoichthys intestinalis]XP_061805351.1 zinc finger protein 281-like [Nerophis lumbriciformis]
MSIIQDKLGNDFLRPNGGMDANFGAGMIMFSHLPPVTSFTRLHSVGPQEMILKKERDSPDCSGVGGVPGAGDYVHALGIKQEKMSEHDYRLPLYPGGLAKSNELLEVTVSNNQSLLVHEVNMANLPSQLGKEPAGRKGRRSNGDGQEGRPRKKRSEAKSMMMDGDAGSMSPDNKPHICEHCSAAFRSSYHLRRHVLIHTGERPFRCSQCNMSFIQKYLLQRHEKIHSGEKPFSCDQCNMRFIQKYHMERHKRTHSGEKPYRCENCQQFFSRTDRLLKHKRTCGDALRKVLDPSLLDMACTDMGSYGITQGNVASGSGRKKGRSKNPGEGVARKKKKGDGGLRVPHISASVSGAYSVHEYSLENQTVSSSTEPGPSMQHHGRAPKVALKKAHRKGLEKGSKEESMQHNVDPGLLQTNGERLANNYDDAMQFLKKRRYLHNVTSSTGSGGAEYDLLSPHPSVIQMTDADSSLDKSGIPDEVLQSLLEHYSHKPDASQHHEIHFDLGDQHVEELQPASAQDLDAGASPPEDKGLMMNEYSRFLLQALERTSHSAGFPLGAPSSGPFLYSECGFGPSGAADSSPQHAFHLLDSAQHHQLTPSQELNASATPPSSYQMSPADPGCHKEAPPAKNGTTAIFPLAPSKVAPYQIENFAQAFGSQFKSEERIRTPVSDYSGYSSLLADIGEPASSVSKTATSQSYR